MGNGPPTRSMTATEPPAPSPTGGPATPVVPVSAGEIVTSASTDAAAKLPEHVVAAGRTVTHGEPQTEEQIKRREPLKERHYGAGETVTGLSESEARRLIALGYLDNPDGQSRPGVPDGPAVLQLDGVQVKPGDPGAPKAVSPQ